MKFKVGLLVDEEHLGHVLAALQKFRVEMVGIDTFKSPTPQIGRPKKVQTLSEPKNITPHTTKSARLPKRILELLQSRPLRTREIRHMALQLGKSEQSAYGAISALRRRGQITKTGEDLWSLVVQDHVEA